jgi:hypothetical protein
MSRSTVRVVSPEESTQETEFYRRANDPHVDKRYVGPDTIILHHHQLGEIGSKTAIRRRGKVVSVLFVLPRVPVERLAAFGEVRRSKPSEAKQRAAYVVQVPQRDRSLRIVLWRASPIGASEDIGELHRIARRMYGMDYRIVESSNGAFLRVWPLPSKALSNGTTD